MHKSILIHYISFQCFQLNFAGLGSWLDVNSNNAECIKHALALNDSTLLDLFPWRVISNLVICDCYRSVKNKPNAVPCRMNSRSGLTNRPRCRLSTLPCHSIITMSTRLFLSRPSGVSFVATGFALP